MRHLLYTIHMYSLLRPGRARCLLCRTAPAYCGCSSSLHAARSHGALGADSPFCGHVLSLLACALACVHAANNRIPFTYHIDKTPCRRCTHALVTKCGERERERGRQKDRGKTGSLPTSRWEEANARTDIRGGRAIRPLLPNRAGGFSPEQRVGLRKVAAPGFGGLPTGLTASLNAPDATVLTWQSGPE